MSKTLKVALTSMFAFAFAFTASAAAPVTTFGSSMKMGSTGTSVKELQMFLNACADTTVNVTAGAIGSKGFETMYFGAATKAAVMKYQAKVGVSATGFFGEKSRAAAAAKGNECADSSNGSTGSTGTTGSTGGSTTLSGTEGYLSNDVKLGAYNGTKVMEGDKDKVVYGFEVLAKDADQKIDSLTVSFQNTPAGLSSVKFAKYASGISVWLDGKEMGRKTVSAFSSDSNDVYSYRFTGMNGIVKKDMKGQVLIAVSGSAVMDSTDATAEAWKVNVGSSVGGNTNFVSASSANGRYRDYGSVLAQSTIDFQKAGTASSDQKFKVTTSSSNPLAQTVQVSNTADTNDVLLAAFDAKAENAAMKVQKVPVTLTITGTDATVSDTAVVKNVKLYANGTLLATESVTASAATTEVITFGNVSKLNYAIPANTTVKFEIKADINDIEDSGIASSDFDNGDKAKVSVNTSTMTVELDNATQDSVSNKTGSLTGDDMTFRSSGVQVTLGSVSSTATTDTNGKIATRTFVLPLSVKAFDDTVYVSQAAAVGAAVAGTNVLAYRIEDNTGAAAAVGTPNATVTSTAPQQGSAYRIDSGSTQTLTLTVVVNGTVANPQNQYRIQVEQIQSFLDAALTTGSVIQDLTPKNSYETTYQPINL